MVLQVARMTVVAWAQAPAMLAVQVRMALIRALIPAAALPLAAVVMGARATAVLIRAAIAATPAAPMVVQPAQKPLR